MYLIDLYRFEDGILTHILTEPFQSLKTANIFYADKLNLVDLIELRETSYMFPNGEIIKRHFNDNIE